MSKKKREKHYMMPIPAGAVPGVYAYVAKYNASRSCEERVAVANNGDWSELEVRTLCQKLRNAASRAAFRRIATEMGGWVTYSQVAEAAGVEIDQLRPILSWFSKYAKQVKGENYWPLELQADSAQEKGEHAKYRMPRKISQWWLAADGGDAGHASDDDGDEDNDAGSGSV